MPDITEAHSGITNQEKTDFHAAQILDDYMPDWVNSMSMIEIDTYLDTNVTDLASAILVMKELAHATKVCGLAVQYLFSHRSPIN